MKDELERFIDAAIAKDLAAIAVPPDDGGPLARRLRALGHTSTHDRVRAWLSLGDTGPKSPPRRLAHNARTADPLLEGVRRIL